MSQRESRLLLAFILVAAAGGFLKFIYPALIRPLFDYRSEIAEASEKLWNLRLEHDDFEGQLRKGYTQYVQRTGSSNAKDVQDELYERINQLIKNAGLKSARVNPKKPTGDRKTKVHTLTFTINARGKFSQCIDFIKGFYEFPYLARLDNLKLTPTDSRGRTGHDEVTLVGEIEALVLPPEKRFGTPEPNQPEKLAKYANQKQEAYDELRRGKPFTAHYVPSTPAPASTSRPSPTPAPVRTPPPRSGPPTDPDRARKFVRMVMAYGSDDLLVREILVQDARSNSTEYVAVGDEFDRGELVLVHPLGVVVHKVDGERDYGYFVYPVGEPLADSVALDDAQAWPEIQAAMVRRLEEQQETVEQGPPIPDEFVGPPYPGSEEPTVSGQETAEPTPDLGGPVSDFVGPAVQPVNQDGLDQPAPETPDGFDLILQAGRKPPEEQEQSPRTGESR